MVAIDKPYTVGLYTLGCKVSQYETEAIAEEFERRGFLRRPFDEPCDVYVINTCTVTAESDRKSRQVIRRAYHKNPSARIMVCGCYAQTTPGDLEKIPGVSYISGTGRKMEIARRAEELLATAKSAPICAVTRVEDEPFEPMAIAHAPRTRAYVKIEDGCECRCTYCAIPGARGLVRSKAPQDVLREVSALAAGGSREIVLTGIETASYGVDLGNTRLIDLLELLDRTPGIPRLRLGSLTPELIRPDFVRRFAALRLPTPHMHLSMQSGCDAVLRGMRRRYNTTMALEGLRALREAIPGIQFTTDMMVGFPGESDENFEETMAFCREAAFLDMHVFAYSRRPGTPAAAFQNQVPETIKHERSARLIALKNEIRERILSCMVEEGKPLSVLFETEEDGIYHGHTDTYVEVSVPAAQDLRGEIYAVRPLAVQGSIIHGEMIK
ncbi:MAG: tRNA (N(6)-L-threonylcarbamoyladenosine(37)-C(2))-methylthiotransferase MtaB [Clostridia bacterium]|nr:tRNA (N(6)-L-threonylcarbamoyladenosine(37)-C(2))-methylthiotransferase MtaB [Clostridia bacterium]